MEEISAVRRSLFALLLLCCLSSCSSWCVYDEGTKLTDLQQSLRLEYQVVQVDVEVNSTSACADTLVISFFNSPFNALSHDEQKQKAREIAIFALERNTEFPRQFSQIWISFVMEGQPPVIVELSNTTKFNSQELLSSSTLGTKTP